MRSDESMVTIVEQYMAFRRNIGIAQTEKSKELLDFARYADQSGHNSTITTELAVRWAERSGRKTALNWSRRLYMVRRLAQHQALFDPNTEIPPRDFFGPSYPRRQPHIYSDEELSALMTAASKLDPHGGLRPRTYVTLFGLLASTGLRISEALNLTCNNVDLNQGLLTIEATKFKKSRLVPLHSSTVEALSIYRVHRNRYPVAKDAKRFFVTERSNPLIPKTVSKTFITLRKRLGWNSSSGIRSPRIHDLRHSFAIRRLVAWYREGANVNHKIVSLATYLGHVKVECTYWYLTATPELLSEAGSRLEKFVNGIQGGAK